MLSRKPAKTDAATFAKMLTDSGFAYEHIKKTYESEFYYHFERYGLARKGYDIEDAFQDFCIEKSTPHILKSYNTTKGLFSTWINNVMRNYCFDLYDKNSIEENTIYINDQEKIIELGEIVEDGVDYSYANELLINVLKCIENDYFRTILEDYLIFGRDKKETIEKLGIDSATYHSYKKRAITRCSDLLYEEGLIDDGQRAFIQKTRMRSQASSTGFMEFLAPGFMSDYEIVPISGNRDIDWIMMKLRNMQ